LLIDTVKQEIHAIYPLAKIIRPHFEPVVGAALLGLEAFGVAVSEDVYERLEATLPEKLKIFQKPVHEPVQL